MTTMQGKKILLAKGLLFLLFVSKIFLKEVSPRH